MFLYLTAVAAARTGAAAALAAVALACDAAADTAALWPWNFHAFCHGLEGGLGPESRYFLAAGYLLEPGSAAAATTAAAAAVARAAAAAFAGKHPQRADAKKAFGGVHHICSNSFVIHLGHAHS